MTIEKTAVVTACEVLRFLVRPGTRDVQRRQMRGFSDPAIFYRWMELMWCFREPEALAFLTTEQAKDVKEFNAIFASVPWQPIVDHSHMSDVAESELAALLPSAERLLRSLESASRTKRWWLFWR